MTRRRKLQISSILLSVPGLIILGYEWKIQGEMGIKADQGYTVDPITGIDLLLVATGIVLVVSSLILFVKSRR